MRDRTRTTITLAITALLLAGCVSNGTRGGEEKMNGSGNAAPELDKGTFAIVVEELNHAYPTLWAWRPMDPTWEKREYWVLYKPGQPGGYVYPGADLEEATLKLDWQDLHHGSGSDANAFLDWIILQYQQNHGMTVTKHELELHTYDRQ